MIVGIGDGELGACGEAGAKSDEKKCHSQDQRFERWAVKNGNVIRRGRRKSAPIIGYWKGVHCGV